MQEKPYNNNLEKEIKETYLKYFGLIFVLD